MVTINKGKILSQVATLPTVWHEFSLLTCVEGLLQRTNN